MRDFPSKENAIFLFIITAIMSFAITDVESQHEYMTIFEKRRYFIKLNTVLYTICLFWAWFIREPAHRMTPGELKEQDQNFSLLIVKKLAKFAVFLSGYLLSAQSSFHRCVRRGVGEIAACPIGIQRCVVTPKNCANLAGPF